MARSALFKKKPEEEKRTKRFPVLWTAKEFEEAKRAAKVRNMDLSEFIRRATLGRRADLDYDTQIVLELHHVVQEIRRWRKEQVEAGRTPPDKEILALIEAAGVAMLRIAK